MVPFKEKKRVFLQEKKERFFSECFFGTNHLFFWWVFLKKDSRFRNELFFWNEPIPQRYDSLTLKIYIRGYIVFFLKKRTLLQKRNRFCFFNKNNHCSAASFLLVLLFCFFLRWCSSCSSSQKKKNKKNPKNRFFLVFLSLLLSKEDGVFQNPSSKEEPLFFLFQKHKLYNNDITTI